MTPSEALAPILALLDAAGVQRSGLKSIRGIDIGHPFACVQMSSPGFRKVAQRLHMVPECTDITHETFWSVKHEGVDYWTTMKWADLSEAQHGAAIIVRDAQRDAQTAHDSRRDDR